MKNKEIKNKKRKVKSQNLITRVIAVILLLTLLITTFASFFYL